MNLAEKQTDLPPAFSYHLLRNALDGFSKNIPQLAPEEYQQAYQRASKSYELESLVLESAEADGVIISEKSLDHSLQEVAARYGDHREFAADMEANGLDETGLREALGRELKFDSVMNKVAAKSAIVTDIDVQLFYEMHLDRFTAPELRHARHILITVNPEFVENSREAALARMEQLVEKLAGRTNRFADFAKRNSECPTAMEGGKLGEIKRGQLYPELDAMLFSMEEETISPIVESEMGFHVLYCEKIKPGKRTPLSKATLRIRELLQERRRRNCQKEWLTKLQNKYQT